MEAKWAHTQWGVAMHVQTDMHVRPQEVLMVVELARNLSVLNQFVDQCFVSEGPSNQAENPTYTVLIADTYTRGIYLYT